MTGPSQITVLGVHRLPFDDVTVSVHLQGFRIPPGPALEELRVEIREMLESTVLVELLVTDRDERFDPAGIRQPDTTKRRWDGVVPEPVAWYLTPDGERRLVPDDELMWGQQSDPPPVGATFRIAMYVRGWDEAKSLRSGYGDHRCPWITAIPERLRRLAPYWWVGD
jgi:hypothetical protein